MTDLTQEGALLVDTFGRELLAYLLNGDLAEIDSRLRGENALESSQEALLGQLADLATRIASDDTRVPAPLRLIALGQFDDAAGTSVGNALRLMVGGDIDIHLTGDPVIDALTRLFRDLYPLMLLPRDPSLPLAMQQSHLVGASWGSPTRKAFEEAALSDTDISRLFVEHDDSGSWRGMVYRSTGSGGTVQLWTLSDTLIANAWLLEQLRSEQPERDAVARTLGGLVDLLRQASRGDACEVKALIGFTGVVLDGVQTLELPFGTLRPVTESERRLAPPSLEGQVSYTTPDGQTVTASYAGDVVLDATVAYRIAVRRHDDDVDRPGLWPVEASGYERLQQHLETAQLGALLTGIADPQLSFLPTWRLIFDPLSSGPLVMWSDVRSLPAIAPRQVDSPLAAELRSWIERVHDSRHQGIDVAVRRTISASSARVDPVDALVDLVIAWENLFGSKQGEPTLRISASLAWLLGSSPADREDIRSKTSKIYSLRSDIVHGNRVISGLEAVQSLTEARALTVSALQTLFRERTALLTLRSGDDRSRALIMGS